MLRGVLGTLKPPLDEEGRRVGDRCGDELCTSKSTLAALNQPWRCELR